MKHTYEKPIITVDAGMAEGVYAASGAVAQVTCTPQNVQNWGGSGQVDYSVDLSNLTDSQLSNLTLVVTFNNNITNAWGGNVNVTRTDNSASLSWTSAPKTFTLSVQANGDITALSVSNISVSNF